MSIEVTCTGCQQRLRIADENAGKAARCPKCETIFHVPSEGATPDVSAAPQTTASGEANWTLKTEDGRTYGPVAKSEMDDWVKQGRVTARSQLMQERAGQWVWATEIYPQLGAGTTQPAMGGQVSTSSNPFADNAGPVSQAYAAPQSFSTSGGYVRPHRGGMILAFGIIAFVTGCFIFGLMAWMMGREDQQAMKRGRMDQSGMGMTQAGTILGMINCILTLLAVLFYVGLFAVLIAAG